MAHRQGKAKAFELFKNNLWPPDVAAELKINIRTIQRWFNEWKSVNVANSETVDSSADIATESKQVINETPHLAKVKARGVREWSEGWEEAAIALSDELLLYHRQMRRRMMQIWAEEARKPEINTRILNSLSQQVCRHSDISCYAAKFNKQHYLYF